MPPEPSTDERQLLSAWGAGDERAGATLFRRYYPAIERFFRNKVPQALEDELIQSTFLACVEGRERLRAQTSLRSYLFSIAYKQLCNHYRRRHREPERFDTAELSMEQLAPGPSTLLARGEEQRLLAEALRQIPLDYQVVLELHYWEEQTAAQIGEILELPLGTAKTRLRRARQLVDEQLRQLADSPPLLDRTQGNLERWARQLREGMATKE